MKFFKPSTDELFNSRIEKPRNKWLLYCEGFRIATQLLEKHVLIEDRTDQDFVIYPYCYLLRHYIEISLKEIIDEGSRLRGLQECPSKGGHDLSVLWRKAQIILQQVMTGSYLAPPDVVTDFIQELIAVDLKSDNFRYPIDKSGEPTLSNITMINFRLLADTFDTVRVYLEGVRDLVAIIKENTESSF